MDKKSSNKITIVVQGVPHPSVGASSVVFYWYIKALKAAGYEILCLIIEKSELNPADLTQFSESMGQDETFHAKVLVCANPIVHHAILGPRSVDRELALSVSEQVNVFAPAAIICFDLLAAWTTMFCKTTKKIVWLGDLNFETYWHHIFFSLERRDYRNALENFLYFHPWKRCYIKALNGFSKVIVCAKSSVKQMSLLGIQSEYLPYPWPADEQLVRTPDKMPTIAFFGSLAGLGSLSAVRMLTKEIHPKLIEKYGRNGFRIKLFGYGKFPKFARNIIEKNPEFETLGFVDDIRPILSQCHALIAPIEVPIGNRTRIITALAYELPVIAHANTSLGNPDLLSGENCFLGTTANQLTNYFFEIYANRNLSERLAKNGKELYMSKNNPAVAAKLLIDKLENL